jgi:hypothetical protein
MDKAKENELINGWKARLEKEYEASKQLQQQYKSLSNFFEKRVDRVFLKMEYDRSSELQAEFCGKESFLAFMEAKKNGLVRIIGNVSVGQ